MSLHTSPPPARDDEEVPVLTALDDPPARRPRSGSTGLVRAAGLALTLGTSAWAVNAFVVTLDPVGGDFPVVYKVSTLLFQLGLVGLVAIQLRTRATGTGRLARALLHAEHALLGLAALSSLQWILLPEMSEEAWAVALDLFWPLSMLGMAGLGIRVAVAGRWRGAARVWPAVAETWALVNLPVAALLSASVSAVVAGGHLLAGYAVLGLILLFRPELTTARG